MPVEFTEKCKPGTVTTLCKHSASEEKSVPAKLVMYLVICMTLMQRQGAFIKCFVSLSELGALGLLFLILNLTTTWVIHLNIAVKIIEGVHK